MEYRKRIKPMADINEVFGEYDPNQPIVSIDKDKMRALLQALADLPTKLPKGVAEGLYNTYQFYKNQIPVINAESPEDAIKEALLMFVPGGPKDVYNPSRGARQAVRTTTKGEPNKKDLKQWADYTVNKWQNVYGNAARHKYNDPIYKANQLEKKVGSSEFEINQIQREIDDIITERNLPEEQKGIKGTDWYDKKLQGAQNRLESRQKQHAKLMNEYNEASIDALGYTPREKNWEGVLRDLDRDYLYNGGGSGYMLDKLKAEYGEELGKKYFNDIVEQSYKDYKKDPWNRANSEYPFAQRMLKEHGDL